MRLRLASPPAIEPVTVDEAKDALRIDDTSSDALVGQLITAAREFVEKATRRRLITQTWTATLDRWPGVDPSNEWWDGVREGPVSVSADHVEFPIAPVSSVSAVRLMAEDGSATTWASSSWYLAPGDGFGRLCRRAGVAWPVPLRSFDGIEIDLVVGYGSAPGNVPQALRTAIEQLVAHWFEHREAVGSRDGSATGALVTTPLSVQSILARYRPVRL